MSDQRNFHDPAEMTEAEFLYYEELATMPETNKPNPPRYPFVVKDKEGNPLRNEAGKIVGYRTKSQAADVLIAKGLIDAQVDRTALTDEIEIDGEP